MITRSPSLTGGGTVYGDITITGDLKVEGDGSFTYDEIIEGTFNATGGTIKAASGDTSFVIDSLSGQDARLLLKSDAGGADEDWWTFRADNDQKLYIRNGNTDLHAFTSAGLVGIGTTSPSEKLDLYSTSDADIQSTVVSDSDYPSLILRRADASTTLVDNGDVIGNIQFWGYDGDQYLRTAQITSSVDATAANNDMPGNITFSTTSDGATSPTERMRIDSAGLVGIGTVTPSSYDANGNNLVVYDSGHSGITIASGASSNAQIYFADGTSSSDPYIGVIRYDHSANNMQFWTSATVRMKIDANSRISLSNNDSGDNNTVFGNLAGVDLASGGDRNVLIGEQSGTNITTSDDNTAIGYNAMHGNDSTATTGTGRNTAIGSSSLSAITTGSQNVTIGGSSGATLTTSSNNVLIGHNSGTAINAGQTTTDGTVAIGSLALTALTTGEGNTAIGYQSLTTEDTSDGNVAVGYQSLMTQNAADNAGNTAVGYVALTNLTTAVGMTAVGYKAGQSVTSGTTQTLIGHQTGRLLTVGRYNTALGYLALDAAVEDSSNVAIGHQALTAQNAGGSDGGATDTNNTAVGAFSGDLITTGTGNTLLGSNTEVSANTAANQLVLGNGATGLGDNYATIGNASVTRVYAAQDGAAVLYADATINSSDKRLKENIEDSDLGLEFVNKLRPVRYNYIKDKQDGKTKYGIIAQEVQEVLKESNNEDFAGIKDSDEYLGADYVQFVAPLIKAVQELSAEVKSLKQQLEDK